MCGGKTPVILHMHDSEAAQQNLHAVAMELMDAASILLLGMRYMSSRTHLQIWEDVLSCSEFQTAGGQSSTAW